MSFLQGIVFGIVQGLTEFIPVSSSGHLILAHRLMGNVSVNDLSIDAVLQFATVLAVLVYFWKDLWRLFLDFVSIIRFQYVDERNKTLLFSIIVGTVPALVFGLLLEKYMETIFRNPHLVALALIAGSILMVIAEKLSKKNLMLSIKRGFIIGLYQCLALIPGISRSGSTISGGLLTGLSREEATRFSFLLSFPIIFGSGIKKIHELVQTGGLHTIGFPLVVSFFCSFAVGLLSIHYLIKYLKNHPLTVFVWYRVVLAILIVILL